MSIPSSDEERSSSSDVLTAIFFILCIVFIFGFSIIHVLKHMQSVVPTAPSNCEEGPCTGAVVPVEQFPSSYDAVLTSIVSVDITSSEKDPILRERAIRDSVERAVRDEHRDIKAVTNDVDANGYITRLRIHKDGHALPIEVVLLLPGDELLPSRRQLVNHITKSGECRSVVGQLTYPTAPRRIMLLYYTCKSRALIES